MKLEAFRIVYHGVDHEDYWQGHGVAFTRYTHCVTGIGGTPSEALDDAIEQLACGFDLSSYDLDEIERDEDAESVRAIEPSYHSDWRMIELPEGFWHRVSIDILIGGAS